ncbi:MAG TPA: retroviral-like aspartic protease family protein [Planctomycetota bacterium]|nr:retroviral-like aspartic protease family protein [Planctomycetota bacterium]
MNIEEYEDHDLQNEILPNWENEVGKVTVDLSLSSVEDDALAKSGHLQAAQVRRQKVSAIVDTGATLLVLPEHVIQQLGLPVVRKVTSRFADGRRMERNVYGPVRLEVQGRVVNVDALGGPPGVPALLGQIPLEGLDFMVDSRGQRLVPNPESPDPDLALVDVF